MKITKAKIRNLFRTLLVMGFALAGLTASAQNVNWNGTWQGSFTESGTLPCGQPFNTSGNATVTLSVSGNAVSGTEDYSGEFCYDPDTCELDDIDDVSGTISGSVSGNAISWNFSGTVIDGSCQDEPINFTYNGTVSGQTISGGGGPITTFTTTSVGVGEMPTPPPATDKLLGTQNTDANPTVGEPINVATGNMYDQVTDYQTAGVNPLGFARYYNSISDPESAAVSLGQNWRSTFDRYLRTTTSNSVSFMVAERADGQELVFAYNGSNWTSEADVDVTLAQSGSTWTLTDSDDTQETYNAVSSSLASLTSIKARNGYMQTMQYNAANQLITVTDSFGRTLQFTYQGKTLKTLTAPNGLVVSYFYSIYLTPPNTAFMQLQYVSCSTTPPTGRGYFYQNAGPVNTLLAVALDENGNQYGAWTYDSSGRALTSQQGTNANLTTITYNADGSRTVVNALGLTTVYKFTMLQGVPKLTEMDRQATATTPAATLTQTYDANGYVTGTSDWNTNITSLVNNIHDEPLVMNEAVGTTQVRTTTNAYHATFHLPMRVVAPRKTVDFTYDNNGNPLTRTETDTSTGSVPYPTTGQTRIWTSTFGGLGHVLTVTGPRTDLTATTGFTYDSSNDLSTITDPLGHVTQITNYNGSGLPATLIDPNGVVTTFTYDVRDRLLTRTVHAASGNATNSFAYDAAGQVTTITLPDGSFLAYQYDSAHRLQSVTNSLGESITYALNALGNVTNQTTRTASAGIAKTQAQIVDQLGRMLQQIGASSQTTTYAYDKNGNRISISDGLNHLTAQTFDPLNRLGSAIDPLNNAIHYGYDAQDNLVSVTDPRALFTGYVYDGFGHVIQETSPDQGTTVYLLDQEGNRTNETDARGVVTRRTFDKLNRVTSETFPASPGENIAYTYDSTNGGNFGIGRLTGYTDETGGTTLSHNERGDVISTTRTIAGTAYTTAYGYDLADHIISLTYPSGHIITYARDSQGRISTVAYRPSVSGPVTLLASNVTYLPFGPVSGLVYGNGLNRTQAYDRDYRLTNLTTQAGIAGIQNLSFTYDLANDINSIGDNFVTANSQTFNYDPDYRLTNAVGGYGTIAYGYDADGNRLSRGIGGVTETYNYSPTANQLQSTVISGVTRSFGYASNGNTTGDNHGSTTNTIFGYDNRNRFSALTIGGSPTAGYKYNALGERLTKTVNGTAAHYQYDEHGHLIAESQPGGAVTREYVWLDDMPLAQIENSGAIYYIHPDHLNRPQKMTDATQSIVWDKEPQPFGESSMNGTVVSAPKLAAIGVNGSKQFQMAVSGSANVTAIIQASPNLNIPNWSSLATNTGSFTFTDTNTPNFSARFYRVLYASNAISVTQNLRFPGQYFDAESGLNYNRMRDYDPALGRYIQSDPIGLVAGINLYGYVRDNPLNAVDVLGLHYEYSLSTGYYTHVDDNTGSRTFLGEGYSGAGAGLNNPNNQDVSGDLPGGGHNPNAGPINEGTYTIGFPENTSVGQPSYSLTPNPGTYTLGRNGYMIHADNSKHDCTASAGCIILPHATRENMAIPVFLGDNQLYVVP